MQPSVLVVEDDYLVASHLRSALDEGGWRVIGPAATVAEALDLIADETPMVAVLDVSLNGELVTRVAERLRALQVPFALASAHHDPVTVGGRVLSGAPNLGKPIDMARLRDTLSGLVRGT